MLFDQSPAPWLSAAFYLVAIGIVMVTGLALYYGFRSAFYHQFNRKPVTSPATAAGSRRSFRRRPQKQISHLGYITRIIFCVFVLFILYATGAYLQAKIEIRSRSAGVNERAGYREPWQLRPARLAAGPCDAVAKFDALIDAS